MATTITPSPDTLEYDDGYVVMTPVVQIPSAIAIAFVIIIAVVGNMFTIVAYLTDGRMNSVYDFYIFNLAIADLLLGGISMPFYAYYTLADFTWPFGIAFCKIYMICDFSLCFESILLMLILSLDRLLLVIFGPYYVTKVTKNKAGALVGVSWVISFLVYSPAIIGWDHWAGESIVEYRDCDVEFAYDVTFIMATAFVEFILALVVLVVLNCLIFYKIRMRIKVDAKHGMHVTNQTGDARRTPKPVATSSTEVEVADIEGMRRSEHTTGTAGNTENTPGMSSGKHQLQLATNRSQSADTETSVTSTLQSQLPTERHGHFASKQSNLSDRHNPSSMSRARKEMKAARFLACLVVVFVITWCPYTVSTIVISFCETCVDVSLYEFFNWVLWTKSALNPLLYAANSSRYRRHFRRYLSCGKSKVGPTLMNHGEP